MEQTKIALYGQAKRRIASLVAGETDEIALMATISSELFATFPSFDWVGFYRNVGEGTLKIGPYQGGHGCLTIRFDQGVCGRCASTQKPQVVPDVRAIDHHIACAASTHSELVLPVFDGGGRLAAVLDIDSDSPDAFDDIDVDALRQILDASFASVRQAGEARA